jgi:hypothetical protein
MIDCIYPDRSVFEKSDGTDLNSSIYAQFGIEIENVTSDNECAFLECSRKIGLYDMAVVDMECTNSDCNESKLMHQGKGRRLRLEV